MSTKLALGFMPGGGFALNDPKSFDLAILHRFIHVPTSIDKPTEENWPTLSTAVIIPCPSRRTVSIVPAASPTPRRLRKASSTLVAATTTPRPSGNVTPTTIVATPTLAIRAPCKATLSATPAPQPLHKVISVSVAATIAPRHLHNASSAAIVTSPTPASQPLQKAAITVATSATRSAHKTSPIVSSRSSRMTRIQSRVKKAKRGIRKTGLTTWRTTRLNRQDTQPLPPGPHYGVSRPGSRRRRMVPMTTFKRKGHCRHIEGRPTPGVVTSHVALALRESDAEKGVAMPPLLSSCSLSHPHGHCQPAYSFSPTVASYMVGEEEPEQLSPQAAHPKILELEDELRRIRDVMNSFEPPGSRHLKQCRDRFILQGSTLSTRKQGHPCHLKKATRKCK
ncbi:hypothetical protein ACLOJK_022806 [Asimina triloba]